LVEFWPVSARFRVFALTCGRGLPVRAIFLFPVVDCRRAADEKKGQGLIRRLGVKACQLDFLARLRVLVGSRRGEGGFESEKPVVKGFLT
jgi:hypothetical protein